MIAQVFLQMERVMPTGSADKFVICYVRHVTAFFWPCSPLA